MMRGTTARWTWRPTIDAMRKRGRLTGGTMALTNINTSADHFPVLPLHGGYHLTGLTHGDEAALVTHLSDGKIGEMIPVLPYPYARPHAEAWVTHRVAFRESAGVETTYAIRQPDGYLVGSVGVDDYPVGHRDSAELGYWLAPAERGKGIATAAARAFIDYAWQSLALKQLTASTLTCNPASQRVLAKLGFKLVEVKTQHTPTRKGVFDTAFYQLRK